MNIVAKAPLFVLIFVITLCSQAYAVDFYTAGTPVKVDGYLFSVPEEQQLHLIDQKEHYYESLSLQLTNQNTALLSNASIYEQRISNYKTSADESAKLAIDAQSSSTVKNVLLFGGGLLVGLFSAYAASKALYH